MNATLIKSDAKGITVQVFIPIPEGAFQIVAKIKKASIFVQVKPIKNQRYDKGKIFIYSRRLLR